MLRLWLLMLTATNLIAAVNQDPAKPESPPAQLEKSTLPAAGRQKTLINVQRFGRYSVLASSQQGTAVQLVDRMAGPGKIEGRAGEQDGRLDVFLEHGQYQLLTYGNAKSAGMVRLDLHPFVERNLPQPPRLVELKLVEQQLQDFEQISYWIEVKQRQFVVLEAAGRSLADLRLWMDGNWLVDAQPVTQIIYPKAGQPLLSCILNVQLDPGLYLLTAYGGPLQPWSEDSKSSPFYLRQGLPRLGAAGRKRFASSPFGRDFYLAPGDANYFRLELPEARPAELRVDLFKPGNPLDLTSPPSAITKKSVPPVAELNLEGDKADRIVSVTAEAGQAYILEQFELKHEYGFTGSGDYWISSVHSGFAADSADATAIVASNPVSAQSRVAPLVAQTLEIGSKDYWHRRINLLDNTSLFLHIKNTGIYQLICQGVAAQYRVEPFFTSPPTNYQPPPPKKCGENWNLDAGYYQLTIFPEKKGIADLVIRPMGLLDSIMSAVGWERSLATTPVHGSVRFPRVSLDQNRRYTFYINEQPEVKSGLILRRLPLDLADPLYIAQEPGGSVAVPFRVKEAGTLRAEAEDGSLLEVSVDAGPWQTSIPVDTAPHTASVRHSRNVTADYSLFVVPQSIDPRSALPVISPQTLAALPKFPVVNDATPQFGDLAKEQSATFLLKADKAALYQLQSTGLLATAGTLRSRTNPSFVRKSQNGVGRNFNLQQHLREGDYQVTVKTEGDSAGHFGLEMARTPIRNGGFLTSRIPARTTLEPGQAIAYYFRITTPGEFRLRALGEGRIFHCRLEDKDGWPVLPPDTEADITRHFSSGQYKLTILPEVTTARVVAQIEPSSKQRLFKGHGPHALRLAEKVDHIWMEPEDGAPRTPDQWEFAVPAPLEACVELSGEMQGRLFRIEDSGAAEVAAVQPGRCWKGSLSMGRYRLEATAMRRNNRAPYQVAVWPTELVPGLSRELTVPASLPVSVGKTGLIELSSFGSDDVQARLYSEKGVLIAYNDDRPNDWNFLITQALSPGKYRLDVDPAGKPNAQTTISMLAPQEETQSALTLPAQLKPVLKRAVQIYPLPRFPNPAMLSALVESSDNVGLAIEVLREGVWQILANQTEKSPSLRIPVAAGDYRLRLWSLDRREMEVAFRVDSVVPKILNEAQLQTGFVPDQTPTGASSTDMAALVKLDRSGLFQADGDQANACWSAGTQQPCLPANKKLIVAWGDEIWIAFPSSQAPKMIRAHRVVVSSESEAPQFPMRDQGSVRFDLAANGGNPVVLLASSQEGQPAVQLMEREQRRILSLRNVAISARESASVLLASPESVAAVWAATPESAGIDVRLRPYYYPAPETVNWAGAGDGKLEGIHACAFLMGRGPKRFHLAVGNAMLAVLSRGGEIASVLWQGGDPFSASVDSDADRVTLLHTRQGEDRYSVEVIPLTPGELPQSLVQGAPYEKNHFRSGTEILTISPFAENQNRPVTLHIRGAFSRAVFLSNAGQVSRGSDFTVPPGGGTLEIAHDPGFVLMWMDQPGSEAQGLWPGDAGLSKPVPITLPATRKLQNSAEAFEISNTAPILVHIRMPSSSVSLVKRGAEKPEVSVHPDHTLIDAYLPAGISQVCLRAIGGGPFSGAVEFTSSPVTPIGEGLGPEVLLPPGSSRVFSFEVRQAGPVGVGVHASSDTVESELLSGSGQKLGSGTVQISNLPSGIYLLSIRAPAIGEPVTARPAVVGIVPPGTGPPDEVVRKYMEPEESPPQFTSRRSAPAEEVGNEESGSEENTGDSEEGTIGDDEGESPDQ